MGPIVLDDRLGLHDDRPARKPRFRELPTRVSRHDVLWADVEPALTRPLRPWDRPTPRPTAGLRRRTHGRSVRHAANKRRNNRRFR